MATRTGPIIPTGYEGQIADIKRKRDLADALAAQAMSAAPKANYVDALGNLAQTWQSRRLGAQASAEEGMVNQQRLTDYKDYNKQIADAITGMKDNPDPTATLATVAGNPYAQDNPLVEALTKAATAQLEGQQKFRAPEVVTNADGTTGLVSFNEAGGRKNYLGLSKPDREFVYGKLYDKNDMKPGDTTRQDPDNRVMYDIADNLVPNEAKIGADMAVASAGRPTTNVNVAAARAWAAEVPGAIVERLSEGQKGIDSAVKSFPTMLEMGQVLREGKNAFYNGSFSGARKNVAKVASLMGVSTAEAERRIANTEAVTRANMPMIAEVMRVFGGSDTVEELRIAQEATAGKDISYEGATRVYDAYLRTLQNSNNFHNRNVDRALESYPNDDYVRSGIQTFRSELPADMQTQVKKELLRMKLRREGKR